MKNFKRKALIFGLLIGSMSIVACGGGNNGGGNGNSGDSDAGNSGETAKGPWTVKFDTNGGNETYEDQIVENKGLVQNPGTPTRVDPVKGAYTFDEWRSDDGGAWSFTATKVTKNVTLIAHWIARYAVSYKDESGALIGETTYVNEGDPLTAPANPTAPAGKVFYGWQNTNNGGQIWDYTNVTLNQVMDDVEFKPLFVSEGDPQIFEAEECPDYLDEAWGSKGMPGNTYSGGNNGLALISQDFYDETGKNKYGASGDYTVNGSHFAAFAHFLYVKNDRLTWELESDAPATNVTMIMRLSAEYGLLNSDNGDTTSWVDDTTFPITVNGEKLQYGKITFHNIIPMLFIPFQDYYVSATISLNQGKNIIQMKTDNTVTINGTIASSAPVVDCIKLYSSSNLTWPNACPDNLESI